MRFDVITLFPELFPAHLQAGVTRRAFVAEGEGREAPVQVKLWPLRDHAEGAYRRVDARPFGGGPGMVLLAEPLMRAMAAVRSDAGTAGEGRPTVHFTPGGKPLTQAVAKEFARGSGAVLICGRYEGVDQRFVDRYVTHEIGLGDFVLSGGEIPALALLDAVARLVPGVIQEDSHENDSFSAGLLEGPIYSRPEKLVCDDLEVPVPEVLLSGHHGRIERWRREQSLRRTAARRPELIAAARQAGQLSAADERFLASLDI